MSKDSDRELPPESVASKLPDGAGTADDVLAAAGWGGAQEVKFGPDFEPKPKPDFVRRDDEEAYRQGFRER